MNKLEEYRNKQANIEAAPYHETHNARNLAFTNGFDAAIALDLPVKFHLWTQEQEILATAYLSGDDEWSVNLPNLNRKVLSTKEVYQYWRDNIYKPES